MNKLNKLLKILAIFILLLLSNQLIAQTNTSPFQNICAGSLSEPYLINPPTLGSNYQWSLSGGGTLNPGATSDNITVDWGVSPGIYIITVTETDLNGCEGEPVTVDVTVISPSTSTSNVSQCITYSWNGQTYTTSGIYTFASTNSNGCDSTATLNLTINPSTISISNVVACDSYTWNGQNYIASGTYTYASTNSNGCDSIATLNLTINSFTSSPLASNQTACFGTTIPDLTATGVGSTFTWFSDSALNVIVANNSPFSTGQTSVGTYTYYVIETDLNGCESPSATLTLIIYPTPTTGPIFHW